MTLLSWLTWSTASPRASSSRTTSAVRSSLSSSSTTTTSAMYVSGELLIGRSPGCGYRPRRRRRANVLAYVTSYPHLAQHVTVDFLRTRQRHEVTPPADEVIGTNELGRDQQI